MIALTTLGLQLVGHFLVAEQKAVLALGDPGAFRRIPLALVGADAALAMQVRIWGHEVDLLTPQPL